MIRCHQALLDKCVSTMKHLVRIAVIYYFYFSATTACAQDGPEFFEKNIRPLFARQCMACHSATAGMGGLKLDTRENLLKGGGHGPAVTPGKPAESLLLRAVAQTSDLKMPPSGKLKDSEIALLRQWVEMNAPWGAEKPALTKTTEKFWAFIPPKEPAAPEVKNTGWIQSPIDRFVLAPLEAKNLAPAPPADKRALIRRASGIAAAELNLHGQEWDYFGFGQAGHREKRAAIGD